MRSTMYVPWFGQLPFYTHTFLKSCEMSTNILWIVHSDQAVPFSLADNIRWFTCNNISDRLSRVFDKLIIPERKWGRKLCDLKPFWHIIFNENTENTEYRGWCDWDVVHNLSKLNFNFESVKFTSGTMCSPLYIQLNKNLLDCSPSYPKGLLHKHDSCAWDELYYLSNINSKIIQEGMTPEVDLFSKASYAVHMYRGKHCPTLYEEWINKYCNFEVNHEVYRRV